jgi:hypothetical protein
VADLFCKLRRRRVIQLIYPVVDHNKIVPGAVHFGEMNRHEAIGL